ncbi:MAG: hypothetical protein WA956_05690 [Stenotrophomonas sp.]
MTGTFIPGDDRQTPASRLAAAAQSNLILHNNELIEELAAERVRAELAGQISGPTQYPNYRGGV